MTNKEAIKYLIAPFATSTKSYNEYLKQKEAYELAIKALEQSEEKLSGAKMKSGIDNAPTVAINKDFYKEDKSNPINRSDLFQ